MVGFSINSSSKGLAPHWRGAEQACRKEKEDRHAEKRKAAFPIPRRQKSTYTPGGGTSHKYRQREGACGGERGDRCGVERAAARETGGCRGRARG